MGTQRRGVVEGGHGGVLTRSCSWLDRERVREWIRRKMALGQRCRAGAYGYVPAFTDVSDLRWGDAD